MMKLKSILIMLLWFTLCIIIYWKINLFFLFLGKFNVLISLPITIFIIINFTNFCINLVTELEK